MENPWSNIENIRKNIPTPPENELPHTVIEPSALRAAKANSFE
jgi:hypothetical protein